jgi:hypothetical protein
MRKLEIYFMRLIEWREQQMKDPVLHKWFIDEEEK